MPQLDLKGRILERIRGVYAIRSAMSLHGWDQETMMPTGGGNGRAYVMSELAGLLYKAMTAPDLQSMVEDALASSGIASDFKACLHAFRYDCRRKSLLPLALDKSLVQGASLAQQAWVDARNHGEVQRFLPLLRQLIHFKRQEAECLRQNGQPLYESLLQSYEPGMSLENLEPVFSRLEEGLMELLGELRSRGRLEPPTPFPGSFPKATQQAYLKDMMPRIGLDAHRIRLDESAHPFTEGLHRDDVRITVRYQEDNILDSYFSLLHEGGHALYEQGFAEEWTFTPMAEAVSLGVHESQSRFWENCVGRSREFWEGEYPLLRQFFPGSLESIQLDSFLQRVQSVHPSLVRVQADEVTYNLHILLRFRLEKMILEGALSVDDLESAWNNEMQRWFWLSPEHLNEGYLQDVHWAAGLFGYFPTYSLGNMWSAQIRESLLAEFPHYHGMVRDAHFGPILQWMREKIHRPSRQYSSLELMHRATGMGLDPECLLRYLRERYLP